MITTTDNYSNLHCDKCSRITIENGILFCPKCNRWFPIIEGIPSIMPDELREIGETLFLEKNRDLLFKKITIDGHSFNLSLKNSSMVIKGQDKEILHAIKDKKQEILLRDKDARIYGSWISKYQNTVEIASVLKRLIPQQKDIILDVGAGVGRITLNYVQKCSEVVAGDFSFRSLQILKKRFKEMGVNNYHLIQMDCCLLPFREQIFNKVVCTGVLQHIPSHTLRIQTLININKVLVNNGKLIITVFNYEFIKKWGHIFGRNKAPVKKEGYGAGSKLYYYNFSPKEFKRILDEFFLVQEICGIRLNIPKITKILSKFGKLGMSIEFLLEKTFVSNIFGHYLLAKCVKKNI